VGLTDVMRSRVSVWVGEERLQQETAATRFRSIIQSEGSVRRWRKSLTACFRWPGGGSSGWGNFIQEMIVLWIGS